MYAMQAKHLYTQIKDNDSFLKVREKGAWENTAYRTGLLHAGVHAGASTADFR